MRTQQTGSESNARARWQAAALAVLVLGLCAALLIYVSADETEPEAGSYVIVDGQRYPVDVTQSKRYRRNLELYGGKASVVFDEFGRWFADLWKGPRLGVTVGALSVLVSAALFLYARTLPAKMGSDPG